MAQAVEDQSQKNSAKQVLRVMMFSAQKHEIAAFERELRGTALCRELDLVYIPARLEKSTASLAKGARAVSLFATDTADGGMLRLLHSLGVELITLRYGGVSSIDMDTARELGMKVVKSGACSSDSVAEYTVAMIVELNRKIRLGWNRVRNGDLNVNGLVGFDLAGKTVGLIGSGKVACSVARILGGFQCRILVYDQRETEEMKQVGGCYAGLGEVLEQSDILSLHAPLVPATYHMINRETLGRCKKGVVIVNTARGGLMDIGAVLKALREGIVGGVGMDVYEGEEKVFFQDNTGERLEETFERLRALNNVIITGHLAGVTKNCAESAARDMLKVLCSFNDAGDEQG